MRRIRIPIWSVPALLPVIALTSIASASVYTDALADNYGGPEVDLSSVVITNDASNINFTINMNPTADIGTNHFANYEIGFQMNGGVGGQTLINGNFNLNDPTAGNPYGDSVGISTGENYFIGSYLGNPPFATNYFGGAQLYSYSLTGGWTQVGATAQANEVTTVTPSTSFSFPLSALGLSVGSSFHFDVWTTFGSPQAAYDALDNIGTGSPNAPYNSGTTYDSATATGSTFSSTSYTVTAVPEPTSLAVLGLSGLALVARRRRTM